MIPTLQDTWQPMTVDNNGSSPIIGLHSQRTYGNYSSTGPLGLSEINLNRRNSLASSSSQTMSSLLDLSDSGSEFITLTLSQLQLERDQAVSVAGPEKLRQLQNIAYIKSTAETDTYKYVAIHYQIFN